MEFSFWGMCCGGFVQFLLHFIHNLVVFSCCQSKFPGKAFAQVAMLFFCTKFHNSSSCIFSIISLPRVPYISYPALALSFHCLMVSFFIYL